MNVTWIMRCKSCACDVLQMQMTVTKCSTRQNVYCLVQIFMAVIRCPMQNALVLFASSPLLVRPFSYLYSAVHKINRMFIDKWIRNYYLFFYEIVLVEGKLGIESNWIDLDGEESSCFMLIYMNQMNHVITVMKRKMGMGRKWKVFDFV